MDTNGRQIVLAVDVLRVAQLLGDSVDQVDRNLRPPDARESRGRCRHDRSEARPRRTCTAAAG